MTPFAVERNICKRQEVELNPNCIKLAAVQLLLRCCSNLAATSGVTAVSSSTVDLAHSAAWCEYSPGSSLSFQQVVHCSEKWFPPGLVWYYKPWMTPWDTHKVPLVMLEMLPRSRKAMTLQEKVEPLDTYSRLRLALWLPPFPRDDSSCKQTT